MSKFNYVIDNGSSLRLYNSLGGENSLLLIKEKYYEKVKEILNERSELNLDFISKELQVLKKYGYIVPESVNENLLRERNLNDVVNPSNLHLIIMPTEDCNLRCTYCYETHEKGKMSSEIVESIIKYVRNNIKYYTGLNVGWFGGEPLEALDIIQYLSENFIEICKVARKNYRAGITTNAYNLTVDTYRLLYKLHVYEYQISIDGLKKEHDELRKKKDGSGTFDRIIQNIRDIKEVKEIAASNIVLRTNFTKKIGNRLDEYILFFDDLISDDSRFTLQLNKASDWGGDSVKEITDELFDVQDFIHLCDKINAIPNNIDFSYHLEELNPGDFNCYAGKRNSYCIGSDAKIYKCTESFDLNENNIGVLHSDGSMEIDRYLESLWVNTADIAETTKCQNCSYSGCCLYSPCPRNTITSKTHVPVCPRTKGNIKNILNLLDETKFTVLD